jgi:hypothetical protein
MIFFNKLEKIEEKLKNIEENTKFQLLDRLAEEIKLLQYKLLEALNREKDYLKRELDEIKSNNKNLLFKTLFTEISIDLFFLIFIYFSLFLILIYGMFMSHFMMIIMSVGTMILIYTIYKIKKVIKKDE